MHLFATSCRHFFSNVTLILATKIDVSEKQITRKWSGCVDSFRRSQAYHFFRRALPTPSSMSPRMFQPPVSSMQSSIPSGARLPTKRKGIRLYFEILKSSVRCCLESIADSKMTWGKELWVSGQGLS